jgi:hypothetical protein
MPPGEGVDQVCAARRSDAKRSFVSAPDAENACPLGREVKPGRATVIIVHEAIGF